MLSERKERTSHLRVEVTPELHQRIKMRAVVERTTLTALVVEMLEERFTEPDAEAETDQTTR